MNETKCNKELRKHTIIKVLGITTLVLLMLLNITGAVRSSDAWTEKCITLEISKNHEEAIKACNKAIEINPHDWVAWYGKGIVLEQLGMSYEAKKAYKKAVELNPKLLTYRK